MVCLASTYMFVCKKFKFEQVCLNVVSEYKNWWSPPDEVIVIEKKKKKEEKPKAKTESKSSDQVARTYINLFGCSSTCIYTSTRTCTCVVLQRIGSLLYVVDVFVGGGDQSRSLHLVPVGQAA